MKAGNIEAITWNYLGKPNCVLIEYTDGSSLMIPNADEMDKETATLIDAIERRWAMLRIYDFV